MRRSVIAAVVFGLLGLASSAAAQVQPAETDKSEKNKKTGTAASGTALLIADKGKFRILLDGQPVGTEEFEISQSGGEWTARGVTQIRQTGGETREPAAQGPGTTQVSARLRLTPDGAPLHYEVSVQTQKKASATIEFQGGNAKLAAQLGGSQPFLQEFSFGTPRVVILDHNVFHHYAILARLYDWGARGAQTFPVLIPQGPTPGSITVESLGLQSVDADSASRAGSRTGAALELLRVRTADLEVDLYVDESHRLIQLAVPASKAVVLRE